MQKDVDIVFLLWLCIAYFMLALENTNKELQQIKKEMKGKKNEWQS